MRITPAGAGKTGVLYVNRGHGRDHPRRCGENALTRLNCFIARGSPPQVRGKQCSNEVWLKWDGITPAGAGKTVFANDIYDGCKGSPPQVRGKPRASLMQPPYARITPAGAGKTITFS